MKFSTTLVTLFALAASAAALPSFTPRGRFTHPTDGPDGVYGHTMDADGTVRTKLIRSITPDELFSGSVFKRGGTGSNCGGLQLDGDDINAAVSKLAADLGSSRTFYHAISATSGTAVAFGCDYGKGRSTSGAEVSSYNNILNHDCGSKDGYFNLPSLKASYGRTVAGGGFC